MSRIRKRKRAAKHACAAGLRLTPEQVALLVKEYDAMSARLTELTEKSNHWHDRTSDREINALMKRADELTAQHRAMSAHPQINAAILGA